MFPAYAGMNRNRKTIKGIIVHVPRIRGDEPASALDFLMPILCSPHTRG